MAEPGVGECVGGRGGEAGLGAHVGREVGRAGGGEGRGGPGRRKTLRSLAGKSFHKGL